MFTKKANLYFSLASVLLVLGLFLQDWQVSALVLPLASLFFLANLWGLPEKVELHLDHRVIPSNSFGGEDISIQIMVENRVKGELSNVELEEQLPDKIVPRQGTAHIRTRIPSMGRVELSIGFPDPGRGNYTIGPLVARVQDPFGLYLVEKRQEHETLSVMPQPERIRGPALRPRHLGPWPGTIPANIPGPGSEFHSLRSYVVGDDLRRINWKASARNRRLMINETEAERVTDVMIVLDTDVTFYEPSEAELFERGVRAAASVTSLLLKQGNRVGVILQGHERGIIPPKFGKKHERNVLFLLAAAKPGPAAIPTSYVVTLLARLMLPSKAQVILISPLLDPSIVEGMRELAVSGYSTMILSPSPPEPPRFESEAEDLAYRMIMLERSNTLLALEKICTVTQWPIGIPLSTILSKVRRTRPMVLA